MTATTLRPELVADARSECGEGPLWDDRTAVLHWLDVTGRTLHRFDPRSGVDRSLPLSTTVSAIAVRERAGLVAATESGFASLDPESGAVELLAPVEADDPGTRMNDGKVDPAGRFWAGTMRWDGSQPVGRLYCLDPSGHARPSSVSGVLISNGLGWSPDGCTMYYIDTPTAGVDAFDFDPRTGDLGERRRLIELPAAGYGSPDGMCVDAEGFLWVAFWGGWAVRRFAPDGRPDVVVELPVSAVSSCAFGGEGLQDLYVTTASLGLSEDERAEQPLAGGLFRCRPGVSGLPLARFGG